MPPHSVAGYLSLPLFLATARLSFATALNSVRCSGERDKLMQCLFTFPVAVFLARMAVQPVRWPHNWAVTNDFPVKDSAGTGGISEE